MRILYVAHFFRPYIGGLETISETLVQGLGRRGFDFQVLTFSEDPRLPPEDEWGGALIRRFDLTVALRSRDAGRITSIQRAVAAVSRDWEPDLVHVAFTPLDAFLTLGARLHHLAPVLVTFHGWWPVLDEDNPTVTRRLLEQADWVTACSRACLEEVWEFEPDVVDRSSWNPNGISPPHEPVRPVADGPPVVVGAGRLSEEKGFDMLLHAFAAVRKRVPEARLVLAGRGFEEGPLKDLAAELGIAEAVEFEGWVRREDMPALLDRATVVAVPSRQEGFGMIALEAAVRARPVVATRVGGLPEVIEDGVTGVLVDPDAPDQLATAIDELIADRARAARLAEASRDRAERLFSEERLLTEHEDLYRRLGARTRGAGGAVMMRAEP